MRHEFENEIEELQDQLDKQIAAEQKRKGEAESSLFSAELRVCKLHVCEAWRTHR